MYTFLADTRRLVFSCVLIGAVTALLITGTLPEFVIGSVMAIAAMAFMNWLFMLRQPTIDESLDLVREAISEEMDAYLGDVNALGDTDNE